MTTALERMKALREELKKERDELVLRIRDIDEALGESPRPAATSRRQQRTKTESLLAFISKNPGCTLDAICDAFPGSTRANLYQLLYKHESVVRLKSVSGATLYRMKGQWGSEE